jgi:hypothetical protein
VAVRRVLSWFEKATCPSMRGFLRTSAVLGLGALRAEEAEVVVEGWVVVPGWRNFSSRSLRLAASSARFLFASYDTEGRRANESAALLRGDSVGSG